MKKYWLLIVVSVASFVVGMYVSSRMARPVGSTVKVLTKVDTVYVDKPVEVKKEVVRYERITDTVMVNDTVYIPIIQKVYESTTYKAWVSGYNASLDSIRLYNTTQTIVKQNVVYKDRRWGVGVIGGYGVGCGGLSPYIGLGVYYRVF